jgi:hypothetical protein
LEAAVRAVGQRRGERERERCEKAWVRLAESAAKSEIKRQIEWGKEDNKRIVPFDDNIFKYINFVQDFNTK